VSTLIGSQWLTIDLRPEKLTPYLAPSIICSTKEKNRKSDDMDMIYTRISKSIQNALPRNLKYVWARVYSDFGTRLYFKWIMSRKKSYFFSDNSLLFIRGL
jgi:hypothetical protein